MNNVAPEIFSRLAHRSSNCALLCVFFRLRARAVPPSDTKQALELVDKLMGQWKSGATVEELAKMTPPIFVSEALWKSGAKLTDYKVVGEGEMLGPNVRFKISLKYIGKNGTSEERSYNYLVTTTPALTFFREEG